MDREKRDGRNSEGQDENGTGGGQQGLLWSMILGLEKRDDTGSCDGDVRMEDSNKPMCLGRVLMLLSCCGGLQFVCEAQVLCHTPQLATRSIIKCFLFYFSINSGLSAVNKSCCSEL